MEEEKNEEITKEEGEKLVSDVQSDVKTLGLECKYKEKVATVGLNDKFLEIAGDDVDGSVVIFYTEIEELRKDEKNDIFFYFFDLDSGGTESLEFNNEVYEDFETILMNKMEQCRSSTQGKDSGKVRVRNKEELEVYFKKEFPFITEDQKKIFMEVKAALTEGKLFLSDEHIMMCVICKKDVARATKTGVYFAKMMRDYELYNVKIKDIGDMLKMGSLMFVIDENGAPILNDDGTIVWLMIGCKWIKPKIPAGEYHTLAIRTVLIPLLKCFHDNKELMRDGLTFLADMKNFGWENFDLALEKIFGSLLSKCPIRMKKMIGHNIPWYGKVVFKLIYPFMSKKMRSRLMIIDEPDCPKHVNPETFPDIIEGGKAKYDYDTWHKLFFKGIGEDEPIIKKSF